MTADIAIVLLFVMAAVIQFATEKLPVDLAALLIMAALLLSRIIPQRDLRIRGSVEVVPRKPFQDEPRSTP